MSNWTRLRLALVVAAVLGLIWVVLFQIARVPSDGMMPTLRGGDRVLVYQLAYTLRAPFTGQTLQVLGSPQRGDVVVFHRENPSMLYVKRVAGVPGDHIEMHGSRLVINGQEVPIKSNGTYSDGCYTDLLRGREQVGTHQHDLLSCPVPVQVTPAPPGCTRLGTVNGYLCRKDADESEAPPMAVNQVVPEGSYFLIGDNRADNDDSRTYGPVPAANLVGKALLIWASGDLQRRRGLVWERTGRIIE